ncbi:MAG: hypothetical protein J5982_06335 [Bacilli bacterium]|nr:hypothetical protein [Bacilli bacterium]
MKKIILIIISLFFLTGCKDYTELENLGIASSIFIEYDGEYKITTEIYKDKEMEIVHSSGSTISEAISNFNYKSKNGVYLSHLNAVIIDKQVEIKDTVYYFLRNPDVNTNFYLVITDNEDFYDKDENIGLKIKNICSRLKYKDFFQITKDYLNENIDIALPFLDKKLSMDEITIYKKDKLKDRLNSKNTLIYSLLTNKSSNETLKFTIDNRYVVLSVNQISKKIKIDKNIQIDINLEMTLEEKEVGINDNTIKDITYIEKNVNQYMNDYIKDFIEIIKENESDILGLDTLIYNKYKKIDTHFYEYDFDISTKVNINKKGQLLK